MLSGLVSFGDPRLPDRFWSKVSPCPMSGCWLWTATTTGGYGRITVGSRTDRTKRGVYAHRLAYESLVGAVPDGLDLDHLCRVRCCVNPAHLEPVTRQENARRGIGGATTAGRQLVKTHCSAGHEYAGENLYLRRDGSRDCMACRRARLQKPSTIARAKERRVERRLERRREGGSPC